MKGIKGRVAALDLEKLAEVGGSSWRICLLQVWLEHRGRASAARYWAPRESICGCLPLRVEDEVDQCLWCA